MAWNPNIPNPTDLISDSQSQIKQNFQALDPLFTSNGQFLVLPVQAGAPTTSSTQIALYSFISPNTSQQELYMVRTSNGAKVQLTAGSFGTGWALLPSGILIKWGNDSVVLSGATGATTTTKSFPTGSNRPAFNSGSFPFVTITPFYGTSPLVDEDTFVAPVAFMGSATMYTVLCTNRTTATQTNGKTYSWNWIAIGLPA